MNRQRSVKIFEIRHMELLTLKGLTTNSTYICKKKEEPRRIKNEEQIGERQAESQWIVAQRLLSHLQYLDATKSSTKDLSL